MNLLVGPLVGGLIGWLAKAFFTKQDMRDLRTAVQETGQRANARIDALQTQVLVAAGRVPERAVRPATEASEGALGHDEARAIAEASDVALVLERSYRRGLPQAVAQLVAIYREEFPGKTDAAHLKAWLEDLRHRIVPSRTGFGQIYYTLDGPEGVRLGNLLRSCPELADGQEESS